MKNQFILVGNVGQKPELKTSKNGNKYLTFSLAVNERYKPKDSTEYKDKTSWFNLIVYDKKAEALAKILDKGTKVSISGKLQVKMQEIDGKKYYNPELVVLVVDLLGSGNGKKEKDESSSSEENVDFSDFESNED